MTPRWVEHCRGDLEKFFAENGFKELRCFFCGERVLFPWEGDGMPKHKRLTLHHGVDKVEASHRRCHMRFHTSRSCSEARKKQLSKRWVELWKDPVFRAKFEGRTLSEEHKQKLSAAHTGVPLSAAHRAAISAGQRGAL